MEGPNGKESSKCGGCMNNIGEEDYVTALSQDWHKDCFRCSVCDALLSSWYLEKDGLLFCKPDYWARFGESCQQCTQVITGPVMAAGAHRFHPECFVCRACGAPIEDTEPYALLERTALFCGGCYSSGGDAHSIRVLTVSSDALRAEPSSRDPHTLTVTQLESSCGAVALHIGDRILEINGAPPRPSALDLRVPALLQLTIEHNPETSKDRVMCNIRPETRVAANGHNTNDHEAEIRDTEMKIEEEKNGIEGKRERLFKRKGDDGGRARVMKRRQTPSSPLLGDKERSSSMSKLLDVHEETSEPTGVLCDLSRARSFRADPDPGQKVFRACDLIQGELLGSGFFGEVYKVTHRATHEVMVLKQLYRVDDMAQRNFLKEVAVLRSLSHPNVLRFVGVVYKDKRLHLVTEYVAGGTLHQLIQDSGVSLSWAERARLARDVSAGVGYLHRKNVIHRDLNSHNCLVREDLTVIVADFGLARLVQRTESSTVQHAAHAHAHAHSTLRRKRYTVVGNPYWMAPEMMNGKVYDEKVDVFSFGVILCEIIGRVSADPDFLPRRSDFGLNEALFVEKFCRHTHCPEPFYRVAFRACHLDPDARPPFEVIEIWLESLVMHLAKPGPLPPTLLADILQYAHRSHSGPETPGSHNMCQHTPCQHAPCQHSPCQQADCQHSNSQRIPCERDKNKTCCQEDKCCHCEITYTQREQCCVHAYIEGRVCGGVTAGCQQCGHCGCRVRRMPSNAGSEDLMPDTGVVKSKSNATIDFTICRPEWSVGRALGKCVSASHIGQRAAPHSAHGQPALSRSQNTLLNPGYILRAVGKNINITKVDDITEWLDSPRQLQRTSPRAHLNEDCTDAASLPAFLRNQSVEGLETKDKTQRLASAAEAGQPYSRHTSLVDTDSSDDEYVTNWYKNVTNSRKMDLESLAHYILPNKSSYDVTDVTLRNPVSQNERKIPEEDRRRYNIDQLTRSPGMAEGIRHIPKTIEKDKEKTNFFTKLSPKFGRLFKHSETTNEDKSKSKFFVQKPVSPSVTRSAYRVRPVDEGGRKRTDKVENQVLKSDIKLASLGKPMTPTFRRHTHDRPDFVDGRFSYRVSRAKEPKQEPKFVDIGRSKIKVPLPIEKKIRSALNTQTKSQNIQNRSQNIPPSQNILNKCHIPNKVPEERKRREGISRSNYVSLANLKIHTSKEFEDKSLDHSPVDTVI